MWFGLLFAGDCWLYGFVGGGPDATHEDSTYGDDADTVEKQAPGGGVCASEDAVNGREDVDAQRRIMQVAPCFIADGRT